MRSASPAPAGPAATVPSSAGAATLAGSAPPLATFTPEPSALTIEPSRRERKKLQTRDALEAAALRLFAEKGYEATTVEEIAEAADVAVRTFFRYFQSKQHVLFGDVAHNVAGRLRTALDARPADESLLDSIGAAMDALELGGGGDGRQVLDRMRLLDQMPELGGPYHLLFQDLHDVIAEFAAGRTGDQPRDMYPQLVAGGTIAAVKAVLSVFQAQPDGRSIHDLRVDAFEQLTRGLHR
jgi:TetR/AcrR family transcriptional regulator, regulator of mycofactocin system